MRNEKRELSEPDMDFLQTKQQGLKIVKSK
jgi:hypothetical protein